MMQGFVDNIIAVTKESVKTFTYESLNNVARLINGVSALLLAVLPGKTNILEGVQGWELRPSFCGPRLPRWMENGVSSFNEFIHELSVDSDTSSHGDYYSGEEDNEEECLPPSPLSHTSRLSRSSSSNRYDRYLVRLIMYFFSWILWTVTLFLRIPVIVFQLVGLRSRGSGPNSSHADQSSATRVPKRSTQVKDDIVQRATDRRRGVIEDLHLAIEIFIESTFDMVHKAAHFLLSPSEICHKISGLFSTHDDGDIDVAVPTATLGDSDPSPTERRTTFNQSLNTDARTCQDVITELGYPYEAIRVVTSDGYVLLLERIPRRDSQKVVYLQHGILDSSMGWVANGVVGSPAFAAYDQGYDVFLGNLRGLVSREHIDKNISSRKYWKYSINEHGTQDIPAMIEKIHEIKTSELKSNCQLNLEDKDCKQPYKFCVVCHSLGGAVMLMYIITRRIAQKPHRLSRMILLSPAGFHEDSTVVFTLAERFALLFGPLIAPVIPGLYIPTRFFRMLLNKLARDFHNYPALGGLVQTLMSYVVGGDSSNWIGVLGLPHYNMYDMPGVSLYVGLHLAQIKRAKRFIMFDYGSEAANFEAYGIPKPLDLGQHFNLIDVPIDLVAGRKDKVIKSSMVRKHYRLMKRAGVEVSYNEFEYAHLDFTFSHREELLSYVMSKLLLVEPPQKLQGSSHQISVRFRKNIRIAWKSEADGGDDDDVEFTDTSKIKPLTAREVEADGGEDDIEFTDTNEIKPLEVEADGGDDEVEFTYTNEIKPLATREVDAGGGDNDVEFTDTNKIKPLNDGGEDNIEFTGTNEIKPLEVEVDGGDDEVEFTDTNGIKPLATREVEADGGDNDVEFTDTNKIKPLTTHEVKADGGEDDIEFTDTNEIKSFEVEADGGDDDIEFTVTDEIKPLTSREVADRGDDDVEFTNTNEIQPFCTREVEADGGDDDVEFIDTNKVDTDGGDDDGEFKDTNEIQPLCTRKVEADGGEDDVEFTDTNEIEPVITLEIVADRGEDDIEFTDTNEIKPLEVEADGGDDEVEFTDTNEIKPLATREVEADGGDNDVEFTDTNKIKPLTAHEVEADGGEDNIEFTGTNEIKPLEVEADRGDDEVEFTDK